MKLNQEPTSIINLALRDKISFPIVGNGATILRYTDRHAYEVLSVSKDNKVATLIRYKRKPKKGLTLADNDYIYDEFIGKTFNIYLKKGKWKMLNTFGKYDNINIIFGVKDEYYDLSF